MEALQADVYAVEGNVAVLRLPGRRFPGALVQGDTMKMVLGIIEEAMNADDPVDARAALTEVHELISSVVTTYETALTRAGERLPYAT